jgi:type I restriction enzyme, S subunit
MKFALWEAAVLIRKSAMENSVSLVLPKHALVVYFDEYALSFFNQIRKLKQQNEKLRAARDLLLPRLMSGEIAV